MSDYIEMQWVPCSVMLPEPQKEVLVTYTVNGKKKRYVETAMYMEDGVWIGYLDEYRLPETKVKRIAWMQMPEPYKGD